MEALDGTLRGELVVDLVSEQFIFARVHAGDREGATIKQMLKVLHAYTIPGGPGRFRGAEF